MIKLLQIEWIKIRKYKAFYIILGLYCVFLVFLLNSYVNMALNFSGSYENGRQLIDKNQLLTYPDIWQNIFYIAGLLKFVLAVILIILTCNEIEYRTFRAHIIEGLNRSSLVTGKIIIAKLLAILSTIIIFIVGLLIGIKKGNVSEFERLEFLPAYFLQVLTYLILSILLALILKKSGLVIILLVMYSIIGENTLIYFFPEIEKYLPISAINSMNPMPFAKYMGDPRDFRMDFFAMKVTLVYMVIFTGAAYLYVKLKDF